MLHSSHSLCWLFLTATGTTLSICDTDDVIALFCVRCRSWVLPPSRDLVFGLFFVTTCHSFVKHIATRLQSVAHKNQRTGHTQATDRPTSQSCVPHKTNIHDHANNRLLIPCSVLWLTSDCRRLLRTNGVVVQGD